MKVLHVLGARGMGWSGGISATLASLAEADLGGAVEFRQATLDEAAPLVSHWHPHLFLWHGACSWRSLPRLLRLRRHCPGVCFEHHYSGGFERRQVPDRRRFRTMMRLHYRLMNRVVAVSEGQADWMRQARLVGTPRLRVIRSSRRLEPFLALPQAAGTDAPPLLVAYGRLTPQKGFATLIEAVQSLPEGSVALEIGGEGPLEADLRQRAGTHPHIRFLGRVDDVPALLGRCTAVVVPSLWEPWGNVCLEARAAGRPVIVSDVDGLGEQARDCGLLVPPGEAGALAGAIRQLLALDGGARGELGHRARASAAHAWSTYLADWRQLLEEFR